MAEPTDPVEDPFTALAAEAAQQHEIYLAYVQAGFTEGQAFELVKTIVATIMGRAT